MQAPKLLRFQLSTEPSESGRFSVESQRTRQSKRHLIKVKDMQNSERLLIHDGLLNIKLSTFKCLQFYLVTPNAPTQIHFILPRPHSNHKNRNKMGLQHLLVHAQGYRVVVLQRSGNKIQEVLQLENKVYTFTQYNNTTNTSKFI